MPGNEKILDIQRQDGGARLVFSGRLDSASVASVWNEAISAADGQKTVSVDAEGVEYCDGAGVALLWELKQRGAKSIDGLNEDITKLLKPFEEEKGPKSEKPARESNIETLGKLGWQVIKDFRDQITFLGRASFMFLLMIRHPTWMRWNDFWVTFERAGVQALVIVGMISFLTGLIMAFQSAVPLQQFGVDIFVVNVVALAMLRELGPIMTAIVLAGRSGSAFAAEIGTMKVNEEINALTTLGLDPVRFLVAPRMLAGIAVTPLLTIFSDLLGVAGGLVVMYLRGFPFAALWKQLTGAVTVDDLLAGLIKSFFFGALVAGIGCLRGLQTQSGPSAVGISTTRAVVTCIFLIIVVDAIFAVVYYAIDF